LIGPKILAQNRPSRSGLSAVVDRLGLLHLAEGPGTDLLGRRHADADGIEMLVRRELLEQVE